MPTCSKIRDRTLALIFHSSSLTCPNPVRKRENIALLNFLYFTALNNICRLSILCLFFSIKETKSRQLTYPCCLQWTLCIEFFKCSFFIMFARILNSPFQILIISVKFVFDFRLNSLIADILLYCILGILL